MSVRFNFKVNMKQGYMIFIPARIISTFCKRQLEASTEREKELEQLLLSEITLREKYSMLQREYSELQSEADDLRRRMVELNKKDMKLANAGLLLILMNSKANFLFVKKKK